ncbi:Bcr/CflA family efflux MFS transporter [Algicella marina]|uniref:Bcr/CflA family efflux transporter n=2 Tax=Algicella marina TaxID=2683284 RepID=A0A6P1TA39_9RHOB|nr:Bcr/CflA family efflux MFS transporter [Algicella marina]
MDSPSAPVSGRWMNRSSPPHITTLVLIAGLAALNMNIILPSLPSMAVYFEADYALVALSISAYLGVTGVLQLFVGPLSDRFGRRPVMLVSLIVFGLATIGTLAAQTITTFLIFRLVQAAIATGLVLSRAVVRDIVGTDRAASMIGWVTMGMSLVPMVGPVLGGALDEMFGFHASFALTLAFGVIVGLIVYFDMGETNHNRSASITAQFRQYPDLVTSLRFWGYTLVATFASGAFFAFLGGGPYVATEVLHISPASLGLYFGIIAFGYMIGNFLSGVFSEKVGVNRMMLSGSIIAVAGMSFSLCLFLAGVFHPISLFGPMLFVGLGNGLTLPSANAGMVSVRPHLAGSASGLGGAVMIGGGAGLSAITGALLGPDTGPYPLLFMMLGSSFLSMLVSVYVIHVARIRAASANATSQAQHET